MLVTGGLIAISIPWTSRINISILLFYMLLLLTVFALSLQVFGVF